MPLRLLASVLMLALAASADVYSPVVTARGQVDATSLESLVTGIYRSANATTPRQRAEAIWRFFLTDGRFVKPGFWYHIAGWAYEEPKGEVLDAVKLLNSYGFGLCYHIAPLLEAVYEAGGFKDARVWFLTGHTVAEVFYEGGWHYFDSDMLGYNTVGDGPLQTRRVASVQQIEQDGSIITGNLLPSGRAADPARVDTPWYPADVRAKAIPDLAELFTTSKDNWLFPFKRYASGHTMDFRLRPGERIIRYFRPAQDRLYYLPWTHDGEGWREFPREIAQYKIRTVDGPRSQKDDRLWATGRIEYAPPRSSAPSFAIDMPSPYVIIDASFSMNADLTEGQTLTVDTSTDGGRTWTKAAALNGPYHCPWRARPATIASSPHGKLTAVSGTYGYQVRFTSAAPTVSDLRLTTSFQLNPRTLPEVAAGDTGFTFRTSSIARNELPVRVDQIDRHAERVTNAQYVTEGGQGFLRNRAGGSAELVLAIDRLDGTTLEGVDAGARFLDLTQGLAPDKLTAEVRRVAAWPGAGAPSPTASIAWAPAEHGPWHTVWTYTPPQGMDRALLWPEVDVPIRSVPPDVQRIFVRYTFRSLALDDVRLASLGRPVVQNSPAVVTQVWSENGARRAHTERIAGATASWTVNTPRAATIRNEAIIIECPAQAGQP